MDGRPNGTVDKIADNAWLKMIERIAVPLIGLAVWQMYSDVNSVKALIPLLTEKVRMLEVRADKTEARADAGRAERMEQYQSVIVEIAALKQQVQSIDSALLDQKAILRDINQKLGANTGPRAP